MENHCAVTQDHPDAASQNFASRQIGEAYSSLMSGLRACQSHERVPPVSMLSGSLRQWTLYSKVSNEPFEFGCLTQGFEMWVDFEEGPASATGVDATFPQIKSRGRSIRSPKKSSNSDE